VIEVSLQTVTEIFLAFRLDKGRVYFCALFAVFTIAATASTKTFLSASQ